MAQLQVLDAESVVQLARDLFWDHGYEAVTLQDLAEATGHESSSLDDTFGSKRGLYDAAVSDYLSTVIRPQLTVMVESIEPRQGLLDYFEWLTSHIAGQSVAGIEQPGLSVRGCMLVDSAAGIAAHDDEHRALVAAFCGEMKAAMASNLQRADPDADEYVIARKARLLLAIVVSGLVLARVDPCEAVATLATADDVIW